MNPALSEAIKEAYALAPATVSHIHTIELQHDSLTHPLRLVQGFLNRELTTVEDGLVEFIACPFEFLLPTVDDKGLTELQLTIDNVDNLASDFCEAAMNFPTPVRVLYRPYLSTDLNTPQMDPPLTLYLLNVVVDETRVSGRAVPADYLNMRFPTENYTRRNFPGINS